MNNQNPPYRAGLLECVSQLNNTQFVIPVYQRNYTWSVNKDIKKLIEDLDLILNKEVENHFVGIIIYLEKSYDRFFKQWQLVDGQQRITTTFLLLLALRKYAKNNGMIDVYNGINDNYILNNNRSGDQKLRLKPLVTDDDTYRKILNEAENTINEEEKKGNIYKNFTHFYKWVETSIAQFEINDIIDAIDKLHIVCIPLYHTDNAQQIFESINSTGAPLTSADLIRNYILMNYEDKKQEEYYENYWKVLERIQPDSLKLEEMFRFYLAIKKYELFNKKEVYNEFKKFWRNDNRSIELKLNEIIQYMQYYDQIYLSELSSNELNDTIMKFRYNASLMPAPLLMEFMHLNKKGLISNSQLCEIFNLINTYLIRRSLCDLDTSAITKQFPTFLKNTIKECDGNYKNVVEILNYFIVNTSINKSYYMPNDQQVKNYLSQNNAYVLNSTRAVLDIIEHDDNKARVDLTELSVEHIMPQKSTQYWEEVANVDNDEYTRYANLIGNLTLAEKADNTNMGNKDFESKKEVLRKTKHIQLNEDIMNKFEWNIKTIEDRNTKLIKKINEIFPFQLSNYSIEDKIELIIEKEVLAKAIMHSEDIIEVLSGSQINYSINMKSEYPEQERLIKRCQELIKVGQIELVDGKYILMENIIYSSISKAASGVLLRTINGWHNWKTIDGRIANEIRKK